MKRTVPAPRKTLAVPNDAEFAVLWGALADRFDDRVSPSLVDYDDEREVVEVVVQGMHRDMN